MAKKEKPETPITIVKELLKVEFTDSEKQEFGGQLARITTEIKELKNAKKSVVSEFKSKIDNKEAECESISTKISNGYEYKNVECELHLNTPNGGVKQIIRKDTREVVKEVPMTVDELQVEIDFKQGEAEADGDFDEEVL